MNNASKNPSMNRSSTPLEVRHPCPVCLGAKMEKVTIARDATSAAGSTPRTPLVLDHCARCGGVWFEMGEVQQLRQTDPTALWNAITKRDGIHAMQCHSCKAHVTRDADRCPACGWSVRLDCPICQKQMDVSEQAGLRLDFCRTCKGVWFDHDEIASIWNSELNALIERRKGSMGDGAVSVLDALTYDPFLMYYGVSAAGHVAGAAAGALSHLPDAIGAAPELLGDAAGAAADVASSLFETIFDIIGSLFD
jgi:Zn-finger nucleic acid-binding protein